MKDKKLIALLSIAVCFVLLFCACTGGIEKVDNEPSETDEVTQGTEGESTEAEGTEPQATEPTATEPAATEPTETEPEETEPTEPEPTETQPSGNSGNSNVNTGSGGGYNPGTTEPTEPEATEPPEIVVPAAGSEKNAYTEQITNTSGSFKTVKIPAGETMYYKLKTPGTYLIIEHADAAVVYNGETYQAEDGVVKLELPADDSQYLALQFVNNGAEETDFAVVIQDAVGTKDNPIEVTDIASFTAQLAEGDADGVYYQWVATSAGQLKLTIRDGQANVTATVNGESHEMLDGKVNLAVNAGDAVLLQIYSDGAEAEVTLGGYVAATVDLKITTMPAEAETVVIPAGESAIYTITGAKAKVMKLASANTKVVYGDVIYTADEDGIVSIKLQESPAVLEIYNVGEEAESYALSFDYPIGHQRNPYVITQLGEIELQTVAGEYGYYLRYTADKAGQISFQSWTFLEEVKIDIIVTNDTTGESAALWVGDEENYIASVSVSSGDVLTIVAYAEDASGQKISADLLICGDLYGTEEMPISVQYPGFEAIVPAGETLYYEGFLGGMIFNLKASNVSVSHNGQEYVPDSGSIVFPVVAAGRMPAVFAITNTGTADAVFAVTFTYPVGHMENPASLTLGTNTLTQVAGGMDYYYTFTAVRDGQLILTFDAAAQWLYAVDNTTQFVYGDTQYSDSDPLICETTITVAKGDVISIRVNTYDAENMFETPEGTVVFTAKYITGPVAIPNLTVNTNTNLLPGEYSVYTGQFYDHVLYISNGKDLVVIFDGVEYHPDSKGEIYVTFPAPSGTGEQPDLEFMVFNGSNLNAVRSMLFSGKEVGSKENPEVITMGSHTMTQSQANGADYYYQFNVTARGTLLLTIHNTNTNWLYQVNNVTRGQTGNWQLGGAGGQTTYRLSGVRAGDVVEIVVNTFDPRTGESIVGTVEFTVSMA